MNRSVFLVTVWVLAAALAACEPQSGEPSVPGAMPAPVVTVVSVERRDITPAFDYVGRVEAVDKVDLRARVEGVLEARNFEEGFDVEKGQVLILIEREPYEAEVDQRKADLARAEALLKNAELTLKRNRQLRQRGTVSQSALDDAIAADAEAKAGVLQAKAALRRAALDLGYTEIRSPLKGRIGRAAFSVGNLVDQSSGALATIVSLDPIYVTIAVSEKDLIEARRRGIDLKNPRVAPYLTLSDTSQYAHPGRFDFLDIEVNQGTDTITARAVFPNPDRLLVPGEFVKVIVKQKEAVSALVVPQAAIQEDQGGRFVLVVNGDNQVEVRRVVAGGQEGTHWIIEDGLQLGERVIVEGLQKVRPGLTVQPVAADASG